jgi:ATP/maltotriose-dependent transcriptional regulator MalT
LSAARDHLERSLAFEKTPAFIGGTGWFGPDPDVLCLTSLSDLLFHLGYPDQSLQRSYEAVKAVTRESDPFSYAMAQLAVIQAHCARREADEGAELCRELIALCTEHGFPFWLAVANRCLAWALSLQGRLQESVAMMQEHLENTAGIDAEIGQFNLLPTLAETYGNLGEFGRGLAMLDRWLEVRSKHSDTAIDKIYCRVRGVLLLKAGSTEEAEQSLRKSIQLSVGQSARMDQLWATMALARLLAGQGRRDEARAMLADIYNWFAEGFDTRDLKDAKTLLDQLSE